MNAIYNPLVFKFNTINDFLAQTGSLRFSSQWEDVRQLFTTHGLDAQKMILLCCDHAGCRDGEDAMRVRLALSDGAIVEAILGQGQASGRYHSIVKWESLPIESYDEEDLLARRILTNSDFAALFAKAVESYYYLHAAL